MSELKTKPKVLVVDDETDTVEVVRQMLQKRGYDIFVAYDGDQGLDVARRIRPDVIILDVMMPQQDGWLVCAKLKAIEPAPRIIIFTVLKHGESDRMAKFVQADGIIHKPFTKIQLLEKLHAVLGIKEPAGE